MGTNEISRWELIGKAGFGVAASLLGFATGPVEAAILDIEAIWMGKLTVEAGCDPEPCHPVAEFTKLVEPSAPRPPLITMSTLNRLMSGSPSENTLMLLREIYALEWAILANEVGVFETCCRRHAALQHSDQKAYAAQDRHRLQLIRTTGQLKRKAVAAWGELLLHMKMEGLVGATIVGYPDFVAKMRAEGLSPGEADLLRKFGFNEERIKKAFSLLLEWFNPRVAPRTFEEMICWAITVDSTNHVIETCTCAETT